MNEICLITKNKKATSACSLKCVALFCLYGAPLRFFIEAHLQLAFDYLAHYCPKWYGVNITASSQSFQRSEKAGGRKGERSKAVPKLNILMMFQCV